MKNNMKYLILIFFIFNNFFSAHGEEIKFDNLKFEASTIEYLNQQNLIKASGNVKVYFNLLVGLIFFFFLERCSLHHHLQTKVNILSVDDWVWYF